MDILEVDSHIIKKFNDQKDQLGILKKKLDVMKNTFESKNVRDNTQENLKTSIDNLTEYINDIENDIIYNFYISETYEIIDEYKRILQKPIKISFVGKQVKNNEIKDKIIEKYLSIASKYIDIYSLNIPINDEENKNKNIKWVCTECKSEEFENTDMGVHICVKCYAQFIRNKHGVSSYGDNERVNISIKYVYDRKVHFRDCIAQYQGKQNCTIPEKVYKDLCDQFDRHHLLIGTKQTPKEERFANITKSHIMMFLKELGYSKHYENIHLIHYVFTGIKPDDISHLEEKLLNDFDILIDVYNKLFKHIKRKNFINSQFVLFQLLHKYKHPCNIDKSLILTTNDRRAFHEDVVKTCFDYLEWNYESFY